MNYLSITPCDIANGQGVRTVLWVSGCSLHCPGCHNPESHDRCAGKPFDENAKKELFDALSKPYIRGLTLSGGHPLEDYNLKDLYLLLIDIKKNFPDKDIWLYTGLVLNIDNFLQMYNFTDRSATPKEHKNHNYRCSILNLCDMVIDGPFIQEQRDITLQFRGSTNQRIIDVAKTIEQKEIVLWEKH